MVHLAQQVLLVIKVLRDLQAVQVYKEQQAVQALKETQGQLEQLAQAPLEPKALQGQLVLQVQQVLLGQVLLGLQVN